MVHIPESETGSYGILFVPLLKNVDWTHQIMGRDLFNYFYHSGMHFSINVGTARISEWIHFKATKY